MKWQLGAMHGLVRGQRGSWGALGKAEGWGRDREERRRASEDKEGRGNRWRNTGKAHLLWHQGHVFTLCTSHPTVASLHRGETPGSPTSSFASTTSLPGHWLHQSCSAPGGEEGSGTPPSPKSCCTAGRVPIGMFPATAGGLNGTRQHLTTVHAMFVAAPHSAGTEKSPFIKSKKW